MKILIISPTSGGIGGIAQHVDGLSQFLTGLGHEVDIISSANTFSWEIIAKDFQDKIRKHLDLS